ncbi:hypothetical protein Tco_1036589, partial [Tanacetum coccineum]
SYQRLPRGGIEEVQMMELRSAISSIIMAPVPDRWVWTSDGSRCGNRNSRGTKDENSENPFGKDDDSSPDEQSGRRPRRNQREDNRRHVATIETDKGEGWKAKDHELAEDEEVHEG